jgi:hypothetical protein
MEKKVHYCSGGQKLARLFEHIVPTYPVECELHALMSKPTAAEKIGPQPRNLSLARDARARGQHKLIEARKVTYGKAVFQKCAQKTVVHI